ncbi:MAG: DUF1653 domain-containing protein [Erysipelotrichaceae bacterium]
MSNNTIPSYKHLLGLYKHYKGNTYELIGIAKDSETLELKVVYKALYGTNELWVRSMDMFFETINIEGKPIPRFKKI